MKDLTEIVSTLGFPIAVALFALWNSREHEKYLQNVLETTLKDNTKAIDRLGDLIDGGLMLVRGGNAYSLKGGDNNENE